MPEYAWTCLDISEYVDICVNMPKSAWMAFALYFPILIHCLLERMYIFQRLHKTRSFSLKENDAVLLETKIDFFYSN